MEILSRNVINQDQEDLFHVVIDDPPPPNPWSKNDKKTRTIINLTIDDSPFTNVKNLQTARGAH